MRFILSLSRKHLLPLFTLLIAVAAMLPGVSNAWAAGDGYIFTPITGAQTQIDTYPAPTQHSSKFTITATSSTVLKGGNFTMKAGSATTASVTLSLYQLSSGGAKTLLTSSTYANATAFCTAHGGLCTQFSATVFDFTTPVTMIPGKTYYAELTSPAADVQSEAYFIKGGDTACYVATSNGTLIPGTNCSIGQINPQTAPQLSMTKTAPATASAPGPLSYTINVTNNGDAAATGATIKDQLPAGATYVDTTGSGAGWSCSAASSLLTCTYSNTIAIGATSNNLVINTTVSTANPSPDNYASVDPTGGSSPKTPSAANCSVGDLDAGICAHAATDLIIEAPYLDITISDPAPPMSPGTNSSYTVTVVNHGETATSATPVHAYVVIPTGTTYVPDESGNSDWVCSITGSVVDCVYQGATIDPDQSLQFPITVTLDENTPGGASVVAEAYIGRDGGQQETQPAVCTSDSTVACAEVTTVLPTSYTITKSDPVPALKAGTESVYTLTLTTNGDGVAADVKDVVPDGMTLVSATGTGWTCTVSQGAALLCQKGSVSSTTPEEISVTVAVADGTAGQSLTNYASAGGKDEAPLPGSNCTDENACASNTKTVLAAVYTITKSTPSPGLKVSQESTYTLTVSSDADDVAAQVKDQLPDGFTYVSAEGTGWTCDVDANNLITCDTASLTAESEILVKVTPDATVSGESVTNYASAGEKDAAPTPGDTCTDVKACDSDTSDVSPAGFTMAKGAPTPGLKVGSESVYTLTVTTDGTDVPAEVQDKLPAGLSYVKAEGTGWSCSEDTGLVTCKKTISSTAEETIDVTVRTEPTAGDSVTNYASAGPEGAAPEPGASCETANCDSDTSDVSPAGFTMAKGAPTPGLKVGSESVYTLTVTTDGTDVPAEVQDKLPAGLSYVKAEGTGWSCSEDTGLVTCTKTISSTTEETIDVTVRTEPTATGSLTNYASAGPEGAAPEPGPSCETANCDSNASDVSPAGFGVTKSAPSPGLKVGSESTYTLTVTTDGKDVPAEVQDKLPAGLTYVSAEGTGWECGEDAGLVTCTKTISSTTSEEIAVKVRAEASAVGEDLTNYASAGPEGAAPEPGPACESEDCDSAEAQVAPAGFTIAKSAPVPPLQVNEQSTYTLTVTTDGTDVPAEVKDQLPPGLTFVSAVGTNWNCTVDANSLVTCNKTISSEASEEIAVTVKTAATVNNQNVTNYASAGLDGEAPQPGPSCTDPENCALNTAKVADIREEIKKAVEDDVQAYLAANLDQLIGSFDTQSRLQRFRDTACGVSHDMSMSGDATSHAQNLSANGTFSMKGGVVPTADVPEQCGNTNVWAELDVGYVDGLQDSSATGGMVTAGVEYLFSENFLAGLRVSVDYTDAQFDSPANSEISGWGWLAGPYISAEIADNIFLDGFVGYGTSWNDYSGNYEGLGLSGDFTTQRIAGYLNLQGTWQEGAMLFTPLLGVSYGKAWSDSFDVHNNIVGDTGIDGQNAELGRLKGRLEAGYMITDAPYEKMEVYLAPQVTYDFVRNDGPTGDLLLGDGLWRGGLEGGFRYSKDNFGASLMLGYDGVGVADWNAYRGQLQVNYTW